MYRYHRQEKVEAFSRCLQEVAVMEVELFRPFVLAVDHKRGGGDQFADSIRPFDCITQERCPNASPLGA